jgi:hypothetical protein
VNNTQIGSESHADAVGGIVVPAFPPGKPFSDSQGPMLFEGGGPPWSLRGELVIAFVETIPGSAAGDIFLLPNSADVGIAKAPGPASALLLGMGLFVLVLRKRLTEGTQRRESILDRISRRCRTLPKEHS